MEDALPLVDLVEVDRRVGHRKRTSASSYRSIRRWAKGNSAGVARYCQPSADQVRRLRRWPSSSARSRRRRRARVAAPYQTHDHDEVLAGDQPAHGQHRGVGGQQAQRPQAQRSAPEQVEEEAEQPAGRTAAASRAGSPPRRRPAPAGTPARAGRRPKMRIGVASSRWRATQSSIGRPSQPIGFSGLRRRTQSRSWRGGGRPSAGGCGLARRLAAAVAAGLASRPRRLAAAAWRR